jgi:hypothetical protein
MQLVHCSLLLSALHVSGGFFAHHQELIEQYVQPWVLSCFPAVYHWFGWVGTVQLQLHLVGYIKYITLGVYLLQDVEMIGL